MNLVTGSAGFLGYYVCKELENNGLDFFGVDIRKGRFVNKFVDLTQPNQIKSIIEDLKPKCIIHCVKIAKGADFCEEHPEEAYKYNYLTTFNLVHQIREKPVKFINISSDYVYDGKKGAFTEEDTPVPLNYYGVTKLLGEEITKFAHQYVNLRPTVIFGYDEFGMNFFMQLLRSQNTKQPMRVPVDQISNPTYIYTLTKAIRLSIEKNITGTFNATGPESISRYKLSLKIAEKFSFDTNLIVPVETKKLNQIAQRPLNCSTDSSKLQNLIKFPFPSLDKNINHLFQEYKTINTNA